MSNAILILGESGAGKSSSGEFLDPKETFWLNVTGKDLPIRGFKKNYIPFSKDNPKGNYLCTSNPDEIIKTMNFIHANRPEIKNLLTDDKITE
jgi:hypothetical protein